MKRKFILYPAVALALMTSASLSSCVDTDEPESLEALRNAKAEEIRANAGLISAKADVEKAYVAVVNAKAAQDEAIARQQAAVAAMKEYEAAKDKVQKDLDIAKINAKSEAEVEEAKLKAENALSAEKAKVEQAKYELQDAIAKYKEKIDEIETTYRLAYEGFVYNHNDSTALRKATRDVIDRKRDLSDAQLALSDALTKDDKDFQDAVDNAQKAYDLSVSSRDAVDALLSSMDIAKITEEYNALKAKADNVKWTENEYNVKLAKLNNELTDLNNKLGSAKKEVEDPETHEKTTVEATGLIKAFNEANDKLTAEKNKVSGNESSYNNSKVKLSVECSNSILVEAVGKTAGAFSTYAYDSEKKEWSKDKTLNGIFKYDDKAKKYVAVLASDDTKEVEVRQDQVENVLAELKKAFTAFTTKVTQNPKDYDVAVAKLKSAAKSYENNTIGKDNKSLLRGEWYTQVTNFNTAKSKNDATKYDEDALKAAIVALFGDCGNASDPDAWKIFTTTDAFSSIEQWYKDKGAEVPYGALGEFGKWKKLVNTQANLSTETDFQSDAEKAVTAIDGVKKNYEKTLEEKKKADANVNNVEAVKNADKAFQEAKTAKEAQEKLVKAKQDEINAVTAEQKAVASDSLAAYNNILTALAGFSVENDLFKDKDGNKIKLTVTNFAEKKAEAMKALNEDVAKKEKALAEKKQELEDYKAGRYDKVSDIRKKQDAVKEAERALEDAEAKLERVKANPTVAEASAPATEEPATEEPVTE